MKKIINNKLYDTETAKLIGKYTYGNEGDLSYYEESFYQTVKGQYFIYFVGGALSKYANKTSYNTITGDTGIRLLNEKEAKEWGEKYLEIDEYINLFADVEEG